MSKTRECPSVEQLQQLAAGQLPEPPASSVEQHVLDCDPCAQATLNLVADETLVGAMRGAVTNRIPIPSEAVGMVPSPPFSGERDRVREPSLKSAPSPSLSPEDGGEEFRSRGANASLKIDSPLPERVGRLIEKLRDLPTKAEDDASGATVLSGEAGMDAPPEIDWSTCFAPGESAEEIGRLSGFRVLSLLGHGGMGGVFLAEDMQLGRRVALKVMRPEFASRPGATERFLREAKAVAALHDEHIVTIYQVGQDRGVPFLAQELLHGEALDARLKREGQLSVDESVSIARQIAAGLAAAHERGLIHRDIKPANVFLESRRLPSHLHESSLHAPREESRGEARIDGTLSAVGANEAALSIGFPHAEREGYFKAKLLDFGLARSVDNAENLTQSGMILGTPAYMAPEQARGEAVDGRADLFSLGCVVYRMLTGQQAFGGKDVMATLMALATQEPPAPHSLRADVPRELSDLAMQLLAKSRDARPASARDVVRQLAEMETSLVTRRVSKGVNKGMNDSDPTHFLPDSPTNVLPDSLADAAGYDWGRSTKRTGKSAHPTKRLALALIGMAAMVLLAVVVVKIRTKDGKETEVAINVPGEVDSVTARVQKEKKKEATGQRPVATNASPFDDLDPAAIPQAERFDWQPKELVAVLGSHRQRLSGAGTSVGLSADGAVVLTGGHHYCHGLLLDVANGTEVPAPTPPPESVAVSPDGNVLFVSIGIGNGQMGLRVRDGERWVAREMSLPRAVPNQYQQPWDATFSLDGRFLAASILHDVIDELPKYATYVWDVSVNPPQRVIELRDHKHPSWSPDGQRLAVVETKDFTLRVFDVSVSPPKPHATLPEIEFPRHPAFTLRSRHGFLASGHLAALDVTGTLSVWDVAAAEPKLVAKRDLSKSHAGGDLRPFRTGADRILLFTQAGALTWRSEAGTLEQEFEGISSYSPAWASANVSDVGISLDGKTVASTHLNGMVRVWDFGENGFREKRPIRPQPVGGYSHRKLVMAADGHHFVTDSEDGFRVWKPDGATCRELPRDGPKNPDDRLVGFTTPTQFTTVWSGIRHWKIEAERVVPQGQSDTEYMRPLAAGIDGVVLFWERSSTLGYSPTDLAIWDIGTLPARRLVSWPAAPKGQSFHLNIHSGLFAISRDGKLLVTADFAQGHIEKPTIRLWQRSDDPSAPPTELASIPLPGVQLIQLALSADSRHLALATHSGLSLWQWSDQRLTRLWDKSGQAVAFSPDGQHLATSDQNQLVLYSLSGERKQEWNLPFAMSDLAFTPDGRHLLTANSNGTVYVLRLSESVK